MAKLFIVGVGPGSPDYVTPIAKKTVQAAQLVIGAQRALDLFSSNIRGETLELTAKNISDVLKKAFDAARTGRTIVLLSTGDPGFSGLLRTISNFRESTDVEITVIPGVSSAQVCAARLGICWDEMRLFSFHEDSNQEKKQQLLQAIKAQSDVLLLPGIKAFSPSEISYFLIDNEVDKKTPVAICENLTLKDERVILSTLEGVLNKKFASLCIMVIRASLKQENQSNAKR